MATLFGNQPEKTRVCDGCTLPLPAVEFRLYRHGGRLKRARCCKRCEELKKIAAARQAIERIDARRDQERARLRQWRESGLAATGEHSHVS